MKTTLLLIFLSLLLLSSMSWGQDRSRAEPAADLSLAPGGVAERNFPAFQSSVKVTEELTAEMFDFIAGILGSGRRGAKLDCQVKVETIKTERKFSTGSQWVEILRIEFSTDHMGP